MYLNRQTMAVSKSALSFGCLHPQRQSSSMGSPFGGSLDTGLSDLSSSYFLRLSTGTASSGDSKAMKSTQGASLSHEPLWGTFAGPYA